MAGHNKWSKIKHRKAVVDKRRGKVWTKISKAIIVAAKHGGGDPDSNPTLRYAIDEARYANMPRDTIERAIKKGAGGGETANYENNRYECYGPGGVAIIIDALTDNRTRTITDQRNVFSKYGGTEIKVGEPILRSEAVLVRPASAGEDSRVDVLVRRLQGVLVARQYVLMDYDVQVELVEKACLITPGLESPTVSPLQEPGWVAVRAMVPRTRTNQVMDELYELGARAILVTGIHACRL